MIFDLEMTAAEKAKLTARFGDHALGQKLNEVETDLSRRLAFADRGRRKISGVAKLIDAYDLAGAGDPKWRDALAGVSDDVLDSLSQLLRERFVAARKEMQ